jgi:hypothetical protein
VRPGAPGLAAEPHRPPLINFKPRAVSASPNSAFSSVGPATCALCASAASAACCPASVTGTNASRWPVFNRNYLGGNSPCRHRCIRRGLLRTGEACSCGHCFPARFVPPASQSGSETSSQWLAVGQTRRSADLCGVSLWKLLWQVGLRHNEMASAPGAQTERWGVAGPVGGFA